MNKIDALKLAAVAGGFGALLLFAPSANADTTLTVGGTGGGGMGVQYPASIWPLTGLNTPQLGPSVAQGASALEAQINAAPPGPVKVISYSQGAMAADQAERDITRADVTFIQVANPEGPGGVLSGFTGKHIPILNYTPKGTPVTPHNVVNIKQEYDGMADWPDQPLNLLADANAIAGFAQEHFGENVNVTGVTPTVTKNSSGGTTTSYLKPTKQLPLTQPLRRILPGQVVNGIDHVLRPIINSAYNRPAQTATENKVAATTSQPSVGSKEKKDAS